MAEHSKIPWSIKSFDKIADAAGDHLLLTGVRMPMTAGIGLDEARANAAFIVRAVNCHAELVEALERARGFVEAEAETRGEEDDSYCIRAVPLLAKICSALIKASGETP